MVLGLMVTATAASSLGLSELRGINISMYIRLLIPIVFSRYCFLTLGETNILVLFISVWLTESPLCRMGNF